MQIYSTLTGLIAGITLLGTTSLSALPQTSQSTPAAPAIAVSPAAQNVAGPMVVQPNTQSQGGTAALGVFTLTATGACPGPITIAVSGATPGGSVAIAWSTTTGTFTLPGGACAGTTLGLAGPNLLTLLTADAFGTAGFIVNAPPAACGLNLQAVDLASCTPSGVVVVGGPPPGGVAFPSASSAIVGSVGFIDAESCGYFWSNVRGDGATETISGPASASNMTYDCDITINALNGGNVVDMDLVINGVVVDSFTTDEFATHISRSASFAAIAGPTYVVELRVTNLVPGGGGSTALRYAGVGDNTLTLF